jgi:zinc protease
MLPLLLFALSAFPYPYNQQELPNGLRVVTVTTDYKNVVALYIVVGVGSRNEVEPGKSGFAHLFEHMMFRGTEKFPSEKYQQILQQAGSASNAFTSDDITAYHTIFSKEDLEQILMLEADRFQHLKYPPDALKTESLAVLGEYNKNSANPMRKLDEVLRETIFQRHTYRHSTMGFLKDVQAMPEQYDYSLQFFDRYYRPEYTTIIVAGDVEPARVRAIVDKYWGGWQRGKFKPQIPAEPPQTAPKTNHVDWPSPTLPWVDIAYRTPAYSDTTKDTAALGALAELGFSPSSELYQKLVVQDQKADSVFAEHLNRADPYLFEIAARVKKDADMAYVRDEILAAVKRFTTELVPAERLDAVKRNLRYRFSLSLDNNQAVAEAVTRTIVLRRTPETINRLYALYAQLTPEDIRQVARKYLVESGRTIVTLAYKGTAAPAGPTAASQAPLVAIRVTFPFGSAGDPPDKPGLAALTAAMLAEGGTREMTYKQVLDALFPMAVNVSAHVDKEMTTFSAQTHVDNLEAFNKLFRSMLYDPGWRDDDFRRLKDDAINYLRVSLRGNNDEELGKEVLYNIIYAGTPYGHHNLGAAQALEKITLADVKQFYAGHYKPENALTARSDLPLPRQPQAERRDPVQPRPIPHNRLTIIEKDTRSVAYSFGFPIEVTRAHPDYPALLLASTLLGHHRSSVGRLYQRMREARGLNYGDYAYIEYFPFGMYVFEPTPGLVRHSQIFQIWIRPVEPPTANFALRLALFELDKLVKDGISEDEFERTRKFLSKYVNILTKTKRAELGYAIDSLFYGISDYNTYIKTSLAKLTRDQVNAAIRRHLRSDRLQIVAVAKDAAGLRQQLLADAAPPLPYNSPKPAAIVEEDKLVARRSMGLRPEDITIVPVAQVFE